MYSRFLICIFILPIILAVNIYSDASESIDYWLININPKDSLCIETWWSNNGLHNLQSFKKKLPIDNWIALKVPHRYSASLKELSCIQKIIADEMLQNRETIPNDLRFADQSDMNLIGMPEAWDITTGGITSRGDTIVIAVIDDGFDINHEDLSQNRWHNPGEIPNDDVDNDENGYVDDYFGVNISTGKDNHPMLSHGTSVSGILGATGNNGAGTSGINWNVKIMFISYDHHISQLIEAYEYVLNMRRNYNNSGGKSGAFVVAVNLSSGIEYAKKEDFPLWCMMYDKLGEEGVLSICSASNSHRNADEVSDLPTRCTSFYTIMVTNVGPNDEIEKEASFGRISVDIGAPGEHSLTTDTNNTYNYFRGTSAAAPHVAGAVALLYSSPCSVFFDSLNYNPSSVAIGVKNVILSSGAQNKSLEGITLSGKRLQVDAALKLIQNNCDQLSDDRTLIRFIAPNPTWIGSTKLYFESLGGNPNIHFKMYSSVGIQVQDYTISYEEYQQGFININTKSLSPGLYIVAISNQKEHLETSKLIIY